MLSVDEFAEKLVALNPGNDDFCVSVDTLVVSVDSSRHQDLIPWIFRLFEANPLSDCGAPGTLVHLTEQFYPRYKDLLLASLRDKPSFSAILMANRILNSRLSPSERSQYLSALTEVACNRGIHPDLCQRAQHFVEYQEGKSR
jgi:hypothetical protein